MKQTSPVLMDMLSSLLPISTEGGARKQSAKTFTQGMNPPSSQGEEQDVLDESLQSLPASELSRMCISFLRGGRIRTKTFEHPILLNDVLSHASDKFRLQLPTCYLKYVDEEDDLLTVKTQREFQECLRVFRKQGKKVVEVQLCGENKKLFSNMRVSSQTARAPKKDRNASQEPKVQPSNFFQAMSKANSTAKSCARRAVVKPLIAPCPGRHFCETKAKPSQFFQAMSRTSSSVGSTARTNASPPPAVVPQQGGRGCSDKQRHSSEKEAKPSRFVQAMSGTPNSVGSTAQTNTSRPPIVVSQQDRRGCPDKQQQDLAPPSTFLQAMGGIKPPSYDMHMQTSASSGSKSPTLNDVSSAMVARPEKQRKASVKDVVREMESSKPINGSYSKSAVSLTSTDSPKTVAPKQCDPSSPETAEDLNEGQWESVAVSRVLLTHNFVVKPQAIIDPINFDSLADAAARAFNLKQGSVYFTYVDDEKDEVLIKANHDVAESLDVFKTMKSPILYKVHGESEENLVEYLSKNVSGLDVTAKNKNKDDRRWESESKHLLSMGFHDNAKNVELLNRFNGDIQKAVAELLPPSSNST